MAKRKGQATIQSITQDSKDRATPPFEKCESIKNNFIKIQSQAISKFDKWLDPKICARRVHNKRVVISIVPQGYTVSAPNVSFTVLLRVIVKVQSVFLFIITGFVTRLTRQVPRMEQELLTIPEHLCSLPVFSGLQL
jgi:hypothetical protein